MLKILTVVFSILSISSVAMAESDICNVYDVYQNHIKFLKSHPSFEKIQNEIYWESFLEIGNDLTKSFNKGDEKVIDLAAETVAWRTAWVDSRIVTITRYKQICKNDEGELITESNDGTGRLKYQIVLFKKSNGKWKREAPYISRKSYFLKIDAKKVLDL